MPVIVKEQATPPPEETPRPLHDYAEIGDGLATLVGSAGTKVVVGFPEPGISSGKTRPMSGYGRATRSLVLHPWISPRGRAEALLRRAVADLVEKPGRKRKQAEEIRPWAVEDRLARRHGLATVDPERPEAKPTPAEHALGDRIAAAAGATPPDATASRNNGR